MKHTKLLLAATVITSTLLSYGAIAGNVMTVTATGTKEAGNNGFFATPYNDIAFRYEPSVKKFVVQDAMGVGFFATVINETSGANSFTLEAKALPSSRVVSIDDNQQGFTPKVTLGSKTLTTTYQALDLEQDLGITDNLLAQTDAAGVQYGDLTMKVEQGSLIGGASSAESLPIGRYTGVVAVDFKATWN